MCIHVYYVVLVVTVLYDHIRGNDEAPPVQFKGVVDLKDLNSARGQSISLEYKSLFQSSQSSKSR